MFDFIHSREVAQIINLYDEVSHNYLRPAESNIWFTLSAESEDRRDLLLFSGLKNHREHRVHREKRHRSVLSVVDLLCTDSFFQNKLKNFGQDAGNIEGNWGKEGVQGHEPAHEKAVPIFF